MPLTSQVCASLPPHKVRVAGWWNSQALGGGTTSATKCGYCRLRKASQRDVVCRRMQYHSASEAEQVGCLLLPGWRVFFSVAARGEGACTVSYRAEGEGWGGALTAWYVSGQQLGPACIGHKCQWHCTVCAHSVCHSRCCYSSSAAMPQVPGALLQMTRPSHTTSSTMLDKPGPSHLRSAAAAAAHPGSARIVEDGLTKFFNGLMLDLQGAELTFMSLNIIPGSR